MVVQIVLAVFESERELEEFGLGVVVFESEEEDVEVVFDEAFLVHVVTHLDVQFADAPDLVDLEVVLPSQVEVDTHVLDVLGDDDLSQVLQVVVALQNEGVVVGLVLFDLCLLQHLEFLA